MTWAESLQWALLGFLFYKGIRNEIALDHLRNKVEDK